MDKQVFVQNVKMYCRLRGVKPTVACRESGAGTDLINMIERRGSVPSVERVQLLAQYLDVSTSDLLGENPTGLRDKKRPAVEVEVAGAHLNDEVIKVVNKKPAPEIVVGGQAGRLATSLKRVGIDVDRLSDRQIDKMVKIFKATLEE